jgi:hypothetical protein
MTLSITTKRDQSKIFIRSQFVMRASTDSHNYVDIFRKIGPGGTWEPLSNQADSVSGGENADGIISFHGEGSEASAGEHEKAPFWLDEPNVAKGTTIEYKVYVGLWSGGYVDIGSHDESNPNGRSPELMIAKEIVNGNSCENCVPLGQMPSGSSIQYLRKLDNTRRTISNIPDYNNNKNNFRSTGINAVITTRRANSKVYVQTQFVMRTTSNSHNYVDIWRKIGTSGSWEPLSSQADSESSGENADGIISNHPNGNEASAGEHERAPFWIDEPNVAEGTAIEYMVYVGLWSAGDIVIGSHDNSNPNGRSPELIVLTEVAGPPIANQNPRTTDLMPPGSTLQRIAELTNKRYRVSSIPGYNNNKANFRATNMILSITTKRKDSKNLIRSQFVMRCETNSHNYVDIWSA